mmetsp:Transcript_25024/g.34487  ORF Transcript_25024/g.34487 Transcript_25024/m.34487 type:complete len:227 (-) Transcript_25024:171-851(-)
MSAASSRREALASVVVALGFSGGTLSVAAELLKYGVKEYWEACLGKRNSSIGPSLGLGAMIPFAFSLLVGLTRSRMAIKDTFHSRMFFPYKKTRSYRLQLLIPFLLSFVFLYFSLHVLYDTGMKALRNQKCRASMDEMKAQYEELAEGAYFLGGALGFAAACSASAFFVLQDIRKRRKEKMRRYYSSRYHANTTDEGTPDEEDPPPRSSSRIRSNKIDINQFNVLP